LLSSSFPPKSSSTVVSAATFSDRVDSTDVDSTTTTMAHLSNAIQDLKIVLRQEYTSFFNPMRTEYYANDVSFEDPLNSLQGIQAYQNNVDLLASRTLLGSILFSDAGIVLHSISGGSIQQHQK
jgi:hypothetical protein